MPVRVLVVGKGGREHALAWRLSRDPGVEVYCCPGNPGTATVGINIPAPSEGTAGLAEIASSLSADLTLIGPEQPLVEGVADHFRSGGQIILGPSARAAQLEASKVFAKDFMHRYAIPTAGFRSFSSDQYELAIQQVEHWGAPVVVKASGLAAGKGAIVCMHKEEAFEAIAAMLLEKTFGVAGEEIVIERFLVGTEASVFALCAGTDYRLLVSARDHKRVGEGDVGPNTGGMGAVAPAPQVNDELIRSVCERIIEPTLKGLAKDDRPYNGFLYVGLMLTDDGPKVIEYNCRLGDPEAQVILPLLGGNAAELFDAAARGELGRVDAMSVSGAAACVVLASSGYPGSYRTGHRVYDLDKAAEHALVFHAGTSLEDEGHIVTAGGRVLGVTGLGESLGRALDHAYAAARTIQFEGVFFRNDIGMYAESRPAR